MEDKLIRVLMIPKLSSFDKEESGIKRVVEAYHKYVPQHGIEFVDCKVDDLSLYDLFVIHAGTTNRYPADKPIVAMLHGLYWTADYKSSHWEWKANANVVTSARLATKITVPSKWVAETIQRDMRIDPYIIGHGIEYNDWEHNRPNKGYVLWNKNRNMDVCDPYPVGVLAELFSEQQFISTFMPHGKDLTNIKVVGTTSHIEMKRLVQEAGVFLSTTKETFGIGTLEALASGVPVLGFAHGGNVDIVQHGVNGYLAYPNNYDDLADGLRYCVKFRKILGANAIETARDWGWEKPAELVAGAFKDAVRTWGYEQRELYLSESEYLVAV